MLRNCCFNWRVWAGVGVVAAVILAVAPGAARDVLPVALGLACPLSMLAMMWGMRSSGPKGTSCATREATRARIAELEAELADLPVREPAPVAVVSPAGPAAGRSARGHTGRLSPPAPVDAAAGGAGPPGERLSGASW